MVVHTDSTSVPAGHLMPMPVTTTRGRPRWSRSSLITSAPGADLPGRERHPATARCVPGSPAPNARSCLRSHLCHHEDNGLTTRGDVLEVFFGYRNVEPLLAPHDQFDEVEAIGVEVLLE